MEVDRLPRQSVNLLSSVCQVLGPCGGYKEIPLCGSSLEDAAGVGDRPGAHSPTWWVHEREAQASGEHGLPGCLGGEAFTEGVLEEKNLGTRGCPLPFQSGSFPSSCESV